MITNHDWDAALDGWIAAERERLGGSPTPEEVVAFTSGELRRADAARVRALLVLDPELTALLEETAPRSFARQFAIAASVMVAILGAALVQTVREQRKPFVYASRHVLENPHQRGAVTPRVFELPANEEQYLIELQLPDDASDPEYRIEITDPQHSTILWSAAHVQPPLAISIPHALLGARTYRINVRGQTRVETYWIRIRRSR